MSNYIPLHLLDVIEKHSDVYSDIEKIILAKFKILPKNTIVYSKFFKEIGVIRGLDVADRGRDRFVYEVEQLQYTMDAPKIKEYYRGGHSYGLELKEALAVDKEDIFYLHRLIHSYKYHEIFIPLIEMNCMGVSYYFTKQFKFDYGNVNFKNNLGKVENVNRHFSQSKENSYQSMVHIRKSYGISFGADSNENVKVIDVEILKQYKKEYKKINKEICDKFYKHLKNKKEILCNQITRTKHI